jgi:hypothetical protein
VHALTEYHFGAHFSSSALVQVATE